MEPQSIILIIFWIWIGLLIGVLISKIQNISAIRKVRKNAVKQSRSTTLWYVHEKVAPLLPNFPYHYKDMTFLGKWVDYIVFDGLYEWEVKQVVLVEVKSGKSNLNKNERLIRNAIKAWKVSYQIFRI